MKVLVIGGNRFVGRLLAWRLIAGGHAVALLNRGGIPDPFGDRVERLRGDRTSDLERLTAGRHFDAVVDLAAYTGEDGRRAAEIFEGRAGHYVMVSTGQVYLVREGCPRPSREADYDGPVMAAAPTPADQADWEYGIGKRDCEDALAAAFARSGFPATRVRIPMVNGELDYFRRLEGYLWRLLDGGPVLLPDGGSHRVRHVYGAEVARFLASILGRPETFGQAYNVAQRETPTLVELLSLVREQLGSAAPLVPVAADRLRAAGIDPVAVSPFSGRWMSFLDPARAGSELGFVHAPLETCLGHTLATFLAHPPADRPAGYAGRATERVLVP